MAQVINTNILSLTAQRNLNNSQNALATSLERLSSGLRINSAKDDAAGLAITERFTTQIRGLNQAIRNANDGISFAQTAEGALATVGGNLQRIRELAVQSANDTNSSSDRQALNNEVQQLISEVNRVASSTQFNGQNILDGTLSNLVFQVGANQNQTISVDGVDARGSQLGAAVSEGNAILASAITSTTTPLSDITVQGVAVDLSSATSVGDVISAINNLAADTGVQASQSTTVTATVTAAPVVPTGTATAATSTVTINGVSITLTDVNAGTEADLADRLNQFSAQTGVTAAWDGTAFTLSSEADIEIGADADSVLGGAETYYRGIVLGADVGTTIDVGGTNATALGDFNTNGTTDFTLNATDVLTRDNATEALRTLDFALQQVSGLRSELGAVQIRFESTISNLSVASENLSAARSRILDADFAAETAELTRAQIVQQAGISVLSQANAQPQNVLALLQ